MLTRTKDLKIRPVLHVKSFPISLPYEVMGIQSDKLKSEIYPKSCYSVDAVKDTYFFAAFFATKRLRVSSNGAVIKNTFKC